MNLSSLIFSLATFSSSFHHYSRIYLLIFLQRIVCFWYCAGVVCLKTRLRRTWADELLIFNLKYSGFCGVFWFDFPGKIFNLHQIFPWSKFFISFPLAQNILPPFPLFQNSISGMNFVLRSFFFPFLWLEGDTK